MRSVKWFLMSGLIAILGTSMALAANTEPGKPELPRPVAAGALTDAQLKQMLVDLGYEPKEIKSTTGNPMFLVQIDRDNYRYVFYVSLSGDKQNLWFSAPLRKLPTGSALRSDILVQILRKNFEIGPFHFVLKSGDMLNLELCVRNLAINPGKLRRTIDDLCVNIRNTEPLWNPAKYPTLVPGGKAEPKVAKK